MKLSFAVPEGTPLNLKAGETLLQAGIPAQENLALKGVSGPGVQKQAHSHAQRRNEDRPFTSHEESGGTGDENGRRNRLRHIGVIATVLFANAAKTVKFFVVYPAIPSHRPDIQARCDALTLDKTSDSTRLSVVWTDLNNVGQEAALGSAAGISSPLHQK